MLFNSSLILLSDHFNFSFFTGPSRCDLLGMFLYIRVTLEKLSEDSDIFYFSSIWDRNCSELELASIVFRIYGDYCWLFSSPIFRLSNRHLSYQCREVEGHGVMLNNLELHREILSCSFLIDVYLGISDIADAVSLVNTSRLWYISSCTGICSWHFQISGRDDRTTSMYFLTPVK